MTRVQVPSEERGACALYLSPGISISSQDIDAGFRWLESWDVLMPLLSYERLAIDYALDHSGCTWKTEAAVLDMRQMVYDERLMFLRRGSSADDLFAARDEESCKDADCSLPMLRAVWRAKPLLLALPTSWVGAA